MCFSMLLVMCNPCCKTWCHQLSICDKNRTHTSLTLKYNWETDTCPALPGVVVSVSYESDKKWCPDWYFSMQILRHTWHIFCSIPFNFDWTDETLNLMNWSNINLDELQRRWRNCGTLSCTASATTRCWASWARYMADSDHWSYWPLIIWEWPGS